MKKNAKLFALMAASFCCLPFAQAEQTYQITGDITDGIDLMSMDGYYKDRISGPSAAAATVAGAITHADGLTPQNPFMLISNGKSLTFSSATGLENVPLKLMAADGCTTRSDLQFSFRPELRGGMEVGRYIRLVLPYGMGGMDVAGDGASPVEMVVRDGSEVYALATMRIGTHKGDANFKLINATYSGGGYDFSLGYETSPGRDKETHPYIRSTLYVTNSTFTVRYLTLMEGVVDSKIENCFVTNDVGGVLNVQQINHQGGDYSRVVFAGGRMVSNQNTSDGLFKAYGFTYKSGWPNPRMIVEGVNGHPIDVEIAYDRNLCSGLSNRRITFSGNGGFVKRGAGTLTWNRLGCDYPRDSEIVSLCNYTGDTVVKGGGIRLSISSYAPGRGALALENEGTFFDLNGISHGSFVGVTGSGVVTNGSETAATFSLGYNNQNGDFNVRVAQDIPVVKTGTGILTLGEIAAANTGDLIVSNGTVKLAAGVSTKNFRSVTIAAGATLDVRGAVLWEENIVNLGGTILTDGTTSLVKNFDEDCEYALKTDLGSFEKTGAGNVTIVSGAKVGKVKVSEGGLTLKTFPAFNGKYFKLVFVGGPGSNQSYQISELSLFDAAGRRVNQGTYAYNAIPYSGERREGVNNLLGIAPCETALMGRGGSYYHSHKNGEGPENLFDGNLDTKCSFQYSWGNSAVGFRLPDDAPPVVSYNLTTSDSSTWRLSKWRLYGSADGVQWTLLDEVTEEDFSPTTAKTDYNGGVPFAFDVYPDIGNTTFGPSTAFEIAENATLDLNGAVLSLSGASGAGLLRNVGSQASTLIFGEDDGNCLFDIATEGTVGLVKKGKGALSFGMSPSVAFEDVTLRGGTLDIRGLAFACSSFFNQGDVLADDDTVFSFGGEDDVEVRNLQFSVGNLVKTGTGVARVYGASDVSGTVDVAGGTLTYRPYAFPGRFFRVTFVEGAECPSRAKFRISEFSLFDRYGQRINLGEYLWTPIDGSYKIYGGYDGIADASTLQPCEVQFAGVGGSYYYSIDANCGPDKLFDGNKETCLCLNSSWGNSGVVFRLPDDAPDAVGYTMTSFEVANRVIQWRVEGSVDGKTWVPLDATDYNLKSDSEAFQAELARALAATPGAVDRAEYNGGVPYVFGKQTGAGFPFGEKATVKVAGGATLDLPSVETLLGHLSVDGATEGVGTITRFTPAENGMLDILNLEADDGASHLLPLTVGEVTEKDRFRTWKVNVDGRETSCRLRYANGKLFVSSGGAFVIIR